MKAIFTVLIASMLALSSAFFSSNQNVVQKFSRPSRIVLQEQKEELVRQTIEFKIHPGGLVEYKVTGVKGPECLELTREVNELLGGEVLSMEPTEEMYQDPNESKVTETQKNNIYDQKFSEW
mmetsp:Transcript_9910/g.15125  ORF Transcript_9910/g.15125 Transcript_9910/m.15125 type:complete len:122 (-) Transcript_9910:142-507(-)|eukprot:CAMPEP_0113944202 /NCGR_PEP_ID=MMETSP1339-20121228/31217_1 /TAXON_ID=94617 /ORGANISM="Fibrocapsa japonica" /LENGTH=121 /DNA_ID=CAMNT_0000949301 /DNA_START=91 /DNA_END=453 /DNA_ORIENTATION=+ /assembly_acc=CAM_ASM_000762